MLFFYRTLRKCLLLTWKPRLGLSLPTSSFGSLSLSIPRACGWPWPWPWSTAFVAGLEHMLAPPSWKEQRPMETGPSADLACRQDVGGLLIPSATRPKLGTRQAS